MRTTHEGSVRKRSQNACGSKLWNTSQSIRHATVQGPPGVPTMAVAIIVDDRVDVWEPGVREQIVVASQFNHYPTAAAHACGEGIGTSKRGHNEVARMLNFLTGIRRDLFHFWDNCLNPTVRQLLSRGVPNALHIVNMHEMMSASPYVHVKSMLPSAALPLPPDSVGSRYLIPPLFFSLLQAERQKVRQELE
jgi:hypothetical protein